MHTFYSPFATTDPRSPVRGATGFSVSTPANGKPGGRRQSGLTRRTHPRSARAHRRALRRSIREALRNALNRGGVTLLAGCLGIGSGQAQDAQSPASLYKSEGGSAYVLLRSDNVRDNYLAIHFDAEHNCQATLTVLDYYLDRYTDEEQAGWQHLSGHRFETGVQAQLDNAKIDETPAVFQFDFDDRNDKPVGLLSVSFFAGLEFINQLEGHQQAAFRYRDPKGGWTGRIQYSLAGAHAGIRAASVHCEDNVANDGPRQIWRL